MENKKGYVYLLGDFNNDGIYKIGVTRGTIERRIKKLQTGNSGDIFLVDYYNSSFPFVVERLMHIKHFKTNVKNEWYSLTMEEVKNFKTDCEKFEETIKKNKEILENSKM